MKPEIDRSEVYVTNAVKHFKWEPRGKLRIHKKPNMKEINACRPWLDAELETVKPKLIVALGATAAQGLLGSSFGLRRRMESCRRRRGLPPIIATLHPSAILRAQTDEDRHEPDADAGGRFARGGENRGALRTERRIAARRFAGPGKVRGFPCLKIETWGT